MSMAMRAGCGGFGWKANEHCLNGDNMSRSNGEACLVQMGRKVHGLRHLRHWPVLVIFTAKLMNSIYVAVACRIDSLGSTLSVVGGVGFKSVYSLTVVDDTHLGSSLFSRR
jgi:hypothetical protein